MDSYTELLAILAFEAGMIAACGLVWYLSGYQNLPVLTDEVVAVVIEQSSHDPQAAAAYLAQEPLWPVALMCLLPFEKFLKLYALLIWVVPFGVGVAGRDVGVTLLLLMGPVVEARGSKRDAFAPFTGSLPPDSNSVTQLLSSATSDTAAAAQSLLSADPAMFEFHPLQWWIFCPSVSCAFCLLWKLALLFYDRVHGNN